jgi:hypothetical protein
LETRLTFLHVCAGVGRQTMCWRQLQQERRTRKGFRTALPK